MEEEPTQRHHRIVTPSGSDYYPVAEVASIRPGEGRTVHLRGNEYALFNVGGEFFAIDNACPHRGGPLGAGSLDRGRIHCPLHGWAFDPATGACESRPGCEVRSYPTRIEDGEVLLCPQPHSPPPA
jgi:nitrite reductase/ring-hydroxylating ferredoxin subunit